MHRVEAKGAAIPAIGMGTWTLEGDHCAGMVAEALRVGYRHVDTAAMYRNEEAVGEGLRASGLPREDYFLTTKVWLRHLHYTHNMPGEPPPVHTKIKKKAVTINEAETK